MKMQVIVRYRVMLTDRNASWGEGCIAIIFCYRDGRFLLMHDADAVCGVCVYARFVVCVSGAGVIPARRGMGAARVGDVSSWQVFGDAERRGINSVGARHAQQARQGFFLF